MWNDRRKWLVVTSSCPFTLQVAERGSWQAVVITCKTCLLQSMTRTSISGWFMLVIRMYLWKPSGCSMLTSVVWTSLRWSGYEVEVVRMSYVYKCRLNFLEAVRIWEARHVYPDGCDPDGNACHVSPWGAWHMFSGGGVPTVRHLQMEGNQQQQAVPKTSLNESFQKTHESDRSFLWYSMQR